VEPIHKTLRNAKILHILWIFMDILWNFMDIYGILWIFMDIYGLWIDISFFFAYLAFCVFE